MMDDRDLCSPLRFLGALSSLGARHFYRRRAAHRSGSPNMWSQQPYPDLTDVLGLSAKRASRRNIRGIASRLLPLKSGRRRNITSRSAAAALPWSDVLATVPHYPPHSTHPSAVPKHIAGSARCDFIQLGGGRRSMHDLLLEHRSVAALHWAIATCAKGLALIR